jgi:hypothetical protein
MGLDMYLEGEMYLGSWTEKSEVREAVADAVSAAEYMEKDGAIKVSIPLGYWRKQNAIHAWFVKNVQGGVDECQRHYVEAHQLNDLRAACLEVLADYSKAGTLLPTESGFFFGGTEYDDWYKRGLNDTVNVIDRALKAQKDLGLDLYYQSSW